jgi:tRNA (uracil-5-)-methyltransferase TRM9
MRNNFAQHLLNKVRDDYNHIAPDFANTRANIWPEIVGLFDYIRKGDKVLDLGCGNGRFVNIIKEKCGQYFGTDVSEGLINIAKKNYPNENFQATEALKFPFSDSYFDVIFSIAVLHHIPSKDFRLEFLEEAKRVLKPEGLFVLTVWKPKGRRGIFGPLHGLDFKDVIEPWFGENKGERYFHCFTEKELTKLVQQAGFEIKESGTIKNEKGNRENLYIVAKKL